MKKYKVFEAISCSECNGSGEIFHPLWKSLEDEEIEYPETLRELEDLFIEKGYAFPDTQSAGNGELRSIVVLPEKTAPCKKCSGKGEIDVLVTSIDKLPELPSIYGGFNAVIDRNKEAMFALVGNPQSDISGRRYTFENFQVCFHILNDKSICIISPSLVSIDMPMWIVKQILADNDDFIWLEFGEYRIFHNDTIIKICDNGDVSIHDASGIYNFNLSLSIVSRLYFFDSTQVKLNKKAIKQVTSKSVKNKTKIYVFNDITIEFFDTGYLFITNTQTKRLVLSTSFDPVLFWGALTDNFIFPLLEFDEFWIDAIKMRGISMGISSNGNIYMRDDIQFVLPRYVVSQMYYYCFLFGNFLFGEQ